MKIKKEQEIIKILFKDPLTPYNSRNISNLVGISHAGSFKALKKLEKREIVKSQKIGNASIYSLNMENPLTLREIEMVLTIEAQNHKRWVEEFRQLKDKINFAILFGSILKREDSAKDIDLLVVADKTMFNEIKSIINKKNKILLKKVHLILQEKKDFEKDMQNKNNAIMKIIKTGVILFGQEEITKNIL
ncbi:MAG TPA: hypothetical protein ENG87_05475 [Candidatus Pacearchaeota archaeon]|nr:nucleotidyltransferase domain protein [archaeon BMS3Abin17]HDK42807.1 hypothetical protein [Candidatus Pacearchaeota archaeon]HDZ60698.1 hypothetical protein [Candidatus Pacearchaeota archaeon]